MLKKIRFTCWKARLGRVKVQTTVAVTLAFWKHAIMVCIAHPTTVVQYVATYLMADIYYDGMIANAF